jgi:hypothetical protein
MKTTPTGGPGPERRSPETSRAIAVLEGILRGRREQLLHDAWTVRSLFASTRGPFRRAGYAARVVVPAATAEMDRLGSLHVDPIDEAFWLLAEQGRMLNSAAVDARAVRALCRNLAALRPSQRRAATRLLAARSAGLARPDGSPAANLLLVAVLAGSMVVAESTPSLIAATAARFPNGPPFLPRDVVGALLLPVETRERLDERALALDLAARAGG